LRDVSAALNEQPGARPGLLLHRLEIFVHRLAKLTHEVQPAGIGQTQIAQEQIEFAARREFQPMGNVRRMGYLMPCLAQHQRDDLGRIHVILDQENLQSLRVGLGLRSDRARWLLDRGALQQRELHVEACAFPPALTGDPYLARVHVDERLADGEA
jgi:hypothetical protein